MVEIQSEAIIIISQVDLINYPSWGLSRKTDQEMSDHTDSLGHVHKLTG